VLAFVGQWGVLVVPLSVVSVLAACRQRPARPVVAPLVVCANLAVAVWLMKHGVGGTAPRSGYDAVFAGGTGFPSGHATNAIVIWGLVLDLAVLSSPRLGALLSTGRQRWLVALAGAASGVGVVGLGHHWFTGRLRTVSGVRW